MPVLPHPPALVPERAALFLDLDGTLAPIEAVPEAVGPDPLRTKLLRRLSGALGGRLAVVSGRSLAEIDRILEGAAPAAAGVHGLELRFADGALQAAEPHPAVPAARAELERFAARAEGLQVEDKRLGVTLHYRQAPAFAGEAQALGGELAARTGLALQLGDHVVELRTPGQDKGSGVRALMQRPPFAGASPVFVGDDLTDEDGFRAAAALGGYGVLVGPQRETAAAARLDGVPAVLAWLSSATTAEATR